jgi:glycosyltransferase involved in cell wall biosynthesis
VRVVRIVTRLNRGGPLRQLEALVPGLARLGIAGPVLVGRPAAGEEDASDVLRAVGADVVAVPTLHRGIDPARDLAALRALRAAIRRERPDVVHTHLGKAGALGRLAAAAEGVPAVVHTFHGHHFAAPHVRGLAARLAERALAGRTTAGIALSKRQFDDVARVLSAARTTLVPPGIDVERLRVSVDPARARALRAALAPRGERVLLWLGRLVPVKDPLALLEAAAAARARGAPPFVLVLAGAGPLRARVLAAARAAPTGAVRCVGAVPDPATWIAASDAVVLSSRSEGTPISLLEAGALGRAVAAPAVGGIEDVVEAGRTGLLSPAGDVAALGESFARLVSDDALRAGLGSRAQAHVTERFSAAALVETTASLYRRCVRAGAGATAPERGGTPRAP